eukprot:979237-Prorocentrum_minimum.AAC.1
MTDPGFQTGTAMHAAVNTITSVLLRDQLARRLFALDPESIPAFCPDLDHPSGARKDPFYTPSRLFCVAKH